MSIASVASQVAGANGVTLASRENSLEMPLLVVRGSGNFCETWRANMTALGAEAGESESTPVDTTEVVDNTEAAENTGSTTSETESATNTTTDTGGSSGGGAFGLLTLLVLLGLNAGRSAFRGIRSTIS